MPIEVLVRPVLENLICVGRHCIVPLLCRADLCVTHNLRYTVPKAMDDFVVNNEKKKHSSYGMKSFIL
jgi:hypothetical protein